MNGNVTLEKRRKRDQQLNFGTLPSNAMVFNWDSAEPKGSVSISKNIKNNGHNR